MKTLLYLFSFCFGLSLTHGRDAWVITVKAGITPSTAEFIHHSIASAAQADAECLVIRLNTPGGLVSSTRDIVGDLLTAKVPVIVYVAPAGAQAASAGTFITLAAHVAAMAPGTNIGAAHPVGGEGGITDSVMDEKVTNDVAAFIRSISEKRHRNVRWAEDAVRKSLSLTETEALRDSVIDLVAQDVAELLKLVDGRRVELESGVRSLQTATASVVEVETPWRFSLLDILSNPNIAYLLLWLGGMGLLLELYNPGSILPGVLGVIFLLLGLYAVNTLPVNYAGVAFILVAILLFVLEVKITSYGMLAVGGIVCLFLGSIMLIKSDSPLENISISLGVIIPVVVFTAAFFIFVAGMGLRAQRKKVTTGHEGLIGTAGESVTLLNPDGQVRLHGEIWNATSLDEKIPKGTRVIVVDVNNLRVMVKKTD